MTPAAFLQDCSLIKARVHHGRLRPRRNAFSYTVPYVTLPGRLLEGVHGAGVFSVNAGNAFSVRSTDYGDGTQDGVSFARQLFAARGLQAGDGDVVLVTLPRMLGYGFNPVSFWMWLDADAQLRGVVAEVNNTFGERHFYVCVHPDRRRISPGDRIEAEKVFHVSPFMKVEGHYVFSFAWSGTGLGVRIDLHDADGLILTTSIAGKRQPLSGAALAWMLLRNPMLVFKVIILIHYQAVRLWLKGVEHYRKPEPPERLVT